MAYNALIYMPNTTFKNKKIILAITPDSAFYKCFYTNLKYLGFSTVTILKNEPFKYKNLKDKLLNFVNKTLLNNKDYKKQLIEKYRTNATLQEQTLSNIKDKHDYGLAIRADLFDESVLKKIVSKTKNAYAYQWDGLNRYPKINNILSLFKKFYVFDKNDLKNSTKTYPLTNFYFDCYSELFKNKKPKYDVYYIGSYDSRITDLIEVCEKLNNLGLKLNINIPCQKKHQKILKKYSYISFPKGGLTYEQNLENIANSKIILDFHNPIHNGLSFRAFEALGYNKKLITTNALIKQYDFYNDNNIHVYKNHNDISCFIVKPLIAINKTIKYKYSFTNWLQYVLEQKDSIEINFPDNTPT